MPNWKKLILSGSNASLNSLIVTSGVTGSLFGTSSWSQNTVSASFAHTASYVNILRQNVIISGSLTVSSSLTASGLNYPTTDGLHSGQVIQTNAAGNLTFGDVNGIYQTIKNGEATSLTVGTAVYVSGSQGANPIVYRADAADPNKMPVQYIIPETITAGAIGRGLLLGILEGYNVGSAAAGTLLWVDGNGTLTTTRPTGSSDTTQPIAIVTKTGAGGQLSVLNPGPILLPNLQTGYTWIGNGNNYPIAVATSSIHNVVSSSYALTASYYAGTIEDLGVSPLVVVVATTTTLPSSPVYNNGTLGVGAFLSGSINGALGAIDSTTLNVSDRILVKNQSTQLQNGVYEVTQLGSVTSKYILTRTTDADETTEFDPQVVIPSSGSVNKGLLFAQDTDNPTIGTSAITYTQTTTSNNVNQSPTGTQTLYNIPWWMTGNRQLSRGTTNFQFNSVTKTLKVSGSLIVTGSTTLRGNLVTSGSVQAYSFTGSLFGTSSWAQNAVTASHVNSGVNVSTAYIGGALYTTSNSNAVSTNTTIFTISTVGTYTSGFIDYHVTDGGANARSGQIQIAYVAGQVTHNETATQDIGNTSGFQWDVQMSGSDINLESIVTSGVWDIKLIAKVF